MKWESNKKIIKSCSFNAEIGSYALDSEPLIFENCRERFAVHFTEKTEGFFYKHAEDHGQNIAAFIQKTELILETDAISKFSSTNRSTILWVSPSVFWKECYMRRSIFTILLRAAEAYNRDIDNYEDALFSHKYIDATRIAVTRFLYGFTSYTGAKCLPNSTETVIRSGWLSTFINKKQNEVKKLLTSSSGILYAYGDNSNSLWI